MDYEKVTAEITAFNDEPNEVKFIYIASCINSALERVAQSFIHESIRDVDRITNMLEAGGHAGKFFAVQILVERLIPAEKYDVYDIKIRPETTERLGTKEYIDLLDKLFQASGLQGKEVIPTEQILETSSLSLADKEIVFKESRSIIHWEQFDETEGIATPQLEASDIAIMLQHSVSHGNYLIDHYYNDMRSYLQLLTSKGLNQDARDQALAVAYSSIDDKCPLWGAYTLLVMYVQQHELMSSAVFASLLLSMLSKEKRVPRPLIIGCWKEVAKVLRDQKQPSESNNAVRKASQHDCYNADSLAIKHLEISNWIFNRVKSKRTTLVSYMAKAWIDILELDDDNELKPWINLIDGCNTLYPQRFAGKRFLNQIAARFRESTKDESFIELYSTGTASTLRDRIENLKRRIALVCRSRHPEDIARDTRVLYRYTKRIMDEVFEEQDVQGFMVCMVIQSGLSNHLPFHRHEDHPTHVERKAFSIPNYEEAVKDQIEILQALKLTEKEAVLWVGSSDDALYTVTYSDNTIGPIKQCSVAPHELSSWIDRNLDEISLSTDTSGISGYSEPKVNEDYLQDQSNLKESIASFGQFYYDIPGAVEKIFLVRDYSLASIPPQLYYSDHSLLGEEVDIIVMQSILRGFKSDKHLVLDRSNPYLFSIWLPIETEDFPILRVHSSIEHILNRWDVLSELSILPKAPMTSLVNILVAHGGGDIPSASMLSAGDEYFVNLDKIIRIGPVVVLLVCYSGRHKPRRDMVKQDSLVERLLNSGSQVVVAPAWPLHTDIVPIWLPSFMEKFRSGVAIGDAVGESNKLVYERYPFVGAHRAMCCYGNPDFHISEVARPSAR